MEKAEKDTIEEKKDTEVVELKDEDLKTITAGISNQQKNKCGNLEPCLDQQA